MRPLEIGDESRYEFASPVQLASVDGVLVLRAFRPPPQLLDVPEAHELAQSLADCAERLLEKETLSGDELPMLIAEPRPL
jgi:hypothetical protein